MRKTTSQSIRASLEKPGEENPDHARNNKAQIITEIRRRVGRLSKWTGGVSTLALNLTSAIERCLNAEDVFSFEKKSGKMAQMTLTWRIQADVTSDKEVDKGKRPEVQSQLIRFTAHMDDDSGRWNASAAEIEAVLSLWIAHAHQQIAFAEAAAERELEASGKGKGSEDWLRGSRKQAVEEVRGFQLLGPCTPAMCRDFIWWTGSTSRDIRKISFRKGQNSAQDAKKIPQQAEKLHQSDTKLSHGTSLESIESHLFCSGLFKGH